ncbi:MAG TPA: hypothetical protein VJ696_14595 [Rhodanobacteraceae bacterium]|nr:hypothetical protein [Rhodanobacteraceae bacterium]
MFGSRWKLHAIGWTLAVLAPGAAALAADGDFDPTFGDGGIATIRPNGVDTVALVPLDALALDDGKLLFAGAHHYLPPKNPPFETEARGMLMRMNADGSADATFGNSDTEGVVVMPDLVPGTRLQSIESIAVLDDGSIVGVGSGVADAPPQAFIVKLDANGALDPGFGTGGALLLPDSSLHAVAIDGEGRIVACGEQQENFIQTSVVVRVDGGALDATFGDGGIVAIDWADTTQNGYLSDLALTPDGHIIAGGRYAAYGPGLDSDYAIAKLADDGTLDASFGDGGWRVFHDESGTSTRNAIDRIALLADGRIVFAGNHGTGAAPMRGLTLGRLAPDGSTDTTFGDPSTPGFLHLDHVPDTPAIDATALAVQSDGKLVVSATYFSSSQDEQFLVFRATADGALDTGFADGGFFELGLSPDGMQSDLRSMTLQQDGAIVLGGRVMQALDPPLSDLVAVRLINAPGGGDAIFSDGFDG